MASLSEDLNAIRKGQKKSINDLYESTRIPIPTIEQIESGQIFINLANNEVYLRSYIRTYSKALKISEEDTLRALEEQKAGSYNGFLFKKYAASATVKSIENESNIDSESSAEVKHENGRKKFFTPENLNPKKEKTLKDIEEEDQQAVKTQHTSTTYTPNPISPQVESVDWAGLVKKSKNMSGNSKVIGIAAVVLGVIMLAIAILFMVTGDAEQSGIPQAEVLAPEPVSPEMMDMNIDEGGMQPADTDTEHEVAAVERTDQVALAELAAPDVFGDTLEVLIFAATDKLEPFFVGTENGTANAPYWIEHLTAMRIPFTQEINIRGQFSRMKLIFNGHEIRNFMEFYGDNRTVSIPRSFFLENTDWATPATPEQITYELPEEILARP